MSEENNNQEQLTQQQTGTSQVAQQAAKKTKEKLRKRLANSIKSGAAKQSLMAALGPILLWAFVIIVILIIIIGIAMFLVTMPGMVMEKLKELSKAVGNYVSAFFGADTTEQIDEIEVYGTLDYLEQMGWDLKGEGFLTDYMTESDVSDVKNNLEDSDSATLDTKTGVVRNENDEILKANSDFIFKYLVSDNYVYTIKNNNLATRGEAEGFFENLFGIVTTGIYKIRNFFFGPIYDVLGINEALYGRFGVGLIAIRKEDGSIGAEGNLVNTGTIWNWDSIKINTNNKTLSIAKNSILSTLKAAVTGQDLLNNPIEFNLDGWTGRYGMPLEFLLAIHKSTMMPDLAYDMVENFGTEVNILLHEIDGSAIATYKGTNGYIGFDELNKELNGMEGSNFFSAVISWFDNLSISQKEAQLAFKLGVEHSPDCTCEKGTIEVYTYDGNVVTERDGKYYYTDGDEEKEVSKDELELTATQSDEYVTICSECEEYIQTLMSILQSNTNYDYQAYSPYISSVKDHWYRDVYFVVNKSNLEFVDYDYDYEIMTGERWTLYETDEETGDFVYYILNEDGTTGDKYEGNVIDGEVEYVKGEKSETLRIASIGEDGTKVVKKAVTIKASDTDKLLDLGWNNNNSAGIWSAYEEVDGDTSSMDPLFPDVEDDGSYESIIKKKCYINLTTSGNIAQTGEGQRTETNSDIKKMFLQNYYFRYDGTDTTAEIITALRDKIYGSSKDRYGPIDENILDDYDDTYLSFDDAKYTSEAQNGTYKLSDYVGNVTLNQDSLNAFTMLENTHTLDADYIYRDFKELIVELGYFKKEELTDETPKLLQWIVPDTGSAGYPDRTLDKRENEFGTMVHSKSDIDANKMHTLQELISQLGSEIPDDINKKQASNVNANANGLLSIGNSNISNEEVGAIGESSDGSKKVSQVSIDEFLQTTREMCEYINEEGYDYCVLVTDAGNGEQQCHHAPVHGNPCGLPTTFAASQESVSKHNFCCATLVSWALQNVGVMPDSAHLDGADSLANWIAENLDPEVIEVGQPLKPGDILCYDGHIDLVGEEHNGGFVKYNGGHYTAAGSVEFEGSSCIQHIDGWPSDSRIKFALRLNWGNSKSEGDPYEGYEGNEAVVSPVTGILLDYGTYEKTTTNQTDGENTSKVTTEDPRVNVDLKYGFPNIYENDSEENVQTGDNGGNQQSGDTGFKSEIVSDKVGYAKILVLDAENYQKLESATKNQWQKNSLVRIDQTTVNLGDTDQVTSNRVSFIEALNGTRNKTGEDDDYSGEYEDWSGIDKTVYGYKEFAETYEKYGIAGYVVYIDGFKCELPDESLSGGEEGSEGSGESSVASEIPNGKPLTIDSFKQTETQINSEQSDEDSLIQTKYESDEAYKLASEKSTNKLSAEVDLKTQAAASISIKDDGKDLIFIKEGTVIGRTLTDKELLESADFRNGKYGTYEELRGESKKSGSDEDETEDDSKLIGNYLRIILQDEEGTTIENVEDYMKLDDGESAQAGDQEYQFEEGDLDLLADAIHHEGCGVYCAKLLGTSSEEDQLYLATSTGYTMINKLNSDSGYNHAAGWDWAPSKSQLYNLLCVVPCAAHGGKGWYAISDSGTMGGLKNRADANQYEYCDICYQAAEYIKENDSMNFKNNGKFGSQYSSGEGMPHTCWEQGSGYDGKGKIWVYIQSAKFYLFDTAN